MIRKILIITMLAVLPLFLITCSGSSSSAGDVSVKISFDGVSKLKSINGIPVTQNITKSKAIQASVTTIRIKVYVGTEADGTIVDETLPLTDNVTLEVPSGLGRVFKIYGLDSNGFLVDSGVSAPVDLVGGQDINISISMGPATAEADFSVKLLAEDAISDFADPEYLSAGTKFIADVYRPTIDYNLPDDDEDDEVILGAAVDTVPSTSFTTSLSGLNAYASTPQIVVVRAFTLDGTIAAIGIAAFADLSDGTNSTPIPVVMSRPGKLIITNDAPITSVIVKLFIGGTYKIVDTEGIITDANTVIVSVPNNKTNIGSGFNSGTADFEITVNGVTKSQTNGTDIDDNFGPLVIKWKAWDVNFVTNVWTEKKP